MTGSGHAVVVVGDRRLQCQVRSVNHKGLDIKLKLPASLLAHESDVLAVVRRHADRGRVELALAWEDNRSHRGVSLDVSRARAWLDELGESFGSDDRVALKIGAAELLRLPGVVVDDHADEHAAVPLTVALQVVDEACVALVRMREVEGAALTTVLHGHLVRMENLTSEIRSRSAQAPERLRDRLRHRLEALRTEVDTGRLEQELALAAERVDVTEELERLQLHLNHARKLMLESGAGRRLDFLCQEFLREANTTGSKCQDAMTAHLVVELKAEIERLREQIQNVE